MNKKNYENLSNSDKKIYDKFNKYNSNYFKYKTIFYDKVSKKIANEKSILNNEYFKIIDISKLLNQNKNKINTFQIASITHQFLEKLFQIKSLRKLSSILIFNKYSDIGQST